MAAQSAVYGPIYRTTTALNESIQLHVHLVKGADFAVWIDSGVKPIFPQLLDTMAEAGVEDSRLRLVLHSHSHHDHIGCNGQLKQRTGCLIAAPGYYAAWHSDFERHYQEFARPFPQLVPDTPELREEVLSILDSPQPLDLTIDEGFQVHLGGGVSLTAYSLPGHMLAEVGWFESSTRTLILGDAVTGLDWPIFHSHLSVQGYRNSLEKLRKLLVQLGIERVLMSHFPPLSPAEAEALLNQAHAYIDEVESNIIRLLAHQERTTLAELWTGLCERMGRLREFRSLNMVYAHIQDLATRGLIRETAPEIYVLR